MELALRNLGHRGPDDSGQNVFELNPEFDAVIGHTRLSIIDLTEGGHQPYSDSSRYALTYNGEIYNYLELRRELEREGVVFRSKSDTEVLFQSLICWGQDALLKLDGMFAFAFLDRQEKRMLLARDPFGIKPLYYHSGPDLFAFGSEPRSLRVLLPELNEANQSTLARFLLFGHHDKTEETFYAGLHSLQAGHLIEINAKAREIEVNKRPYWRPAVGTSSELSFREASDTYRELLTKSVERHMRSDVAVGAALSGGLDSSALVCLAREISPSADIHSFSYIAEGSSSNEESWVDLVVSSTRSIGHKVKLGSDDLFEGELDSLVIAQGEPFPSLSIYAQFKVFQLARHSGIKVTLDGQGADEYLAGYHGFAESRIRSFLEQSDISGLVQFIRRWTAWPGRSLRDLIASYLTTYFPKTRHSRAFMQFAEAIGQTRSEELVLVNHQTFESISDTNLFANYDQDSFKGRRLSEALIRALGSERLSPLLRVADRNSMNFGVESRLPFLSRPLVEFVLSLPEHYILGDNGETKRLLRNSMRELVPSPIVERRDKIGFAPNTNGWGVGSPTLLNVASRVADLPLIDGLAAGEALKDVFKGKRPLTDALWRVVNYAKWAELTGVRL